MKKGAVVAVLILMAFVSSPLYSAEKSHLDDLINQRLKSQFFCGYCHVLTYPKVIKKAYMSWKESKHKNVTCAECHYPPERQIESIAGHKSIPKDEQAAEKGRSEFEYMKTELEVLSKLTTVLNMDESVVRTKPRLDDRNCTTSRCHPQTGTGKEGEYWTKKINFLEHVRDDKSKMVIPYVHKTHFDKTKWVDGQEMHCTTCHQRETRQAHFEVSKEKCYLCHFKNAELNTNRSKCSLCHEVPTQPLQKQKKESDNPDKKPITHKSIEEAKVPCASCHLHLFQGKGQVKNEKCLNCHDNEKAVMKEAFNLKLMHKRHVADQNASCFNCHEPMKHEKSDFLDAARVDCQACHPDHHVQQKMLIAGTGGNGIKQDFPIRHFNVKVNCLACHTRDDKGVIVIKADTANCVACHTENEKNLAAKWKSDVMEFLEEAREIEQQTRQDIDAAKGRVPKSTIQKAMTMLAESQANLLLVEAGGGVHNKKYSMLLLDTAIEQLEMITEMLE